MLAKKKRLHSANLDAICKALKEEERFENAMNQNVLIKSEEENKSDEEERKASGAVEPGRIMIDTKPKKQKQRLEF